MFFILLMPKLAADLRWLDRLGAKSFSTCYFKTNKTWSVIVLSIKKNLFKNMIIKNIWISYFWTLNKVVCRKMTINTVCDVKLPKPFSVTN